LAQPGLEISGTPGEIYQREMVPAIFARWAADLVDLAGVRPGQRVLDVACGTGAVTRVAAERVGPTGRAVGLDLNPDMLGAARVSSPPAIEWYEGSAVSLPFPDGAFDVVLCQQGLQFFPDRAVALGEMRRVLGPGGRLAVSVWRSIEHQPGYQPLERALAKRVSPEKAALPPFGFGDRASLRAVVSGAGFQNVRVRAEVKTVRFASAENMVRALVGGAPTMLAAFAQQGETALAAIVDEVTKELADYVDDEGLGFPAVSHIATALR